MCPYWLGANAADRIVEDCDSHVCSFAGVPTGSSSPMIQSEDPVESSS